MTASTISANDSLSERQQRKRLAAKVRQQRCRQRKREAKLAKAAAAANNKKSDLTKDTGRKQVQVVRGPVLSRQRNSPSFQAPRATNSMSIPMLHHHASSPFVMYPRRVPSAFPVSPNATAPTLWSTNNANSPIMSLYGRRMRPSHTEIMARSSFALEMCKTPVSNLGQMSSPLRQQTIPRVSPVADIAKLSIPVLPDSGRLERKEETAIDAMLCLHRSGSKSEDLPY